MPSRPDWNQNSNYEHHFYLATVLRLDLQIVFILITDGNLSLI